MEAEAVEVEEAEEEEEKEETDERNFFSDNFGSLCGERLAHVRLCLRLLVSSLSVNPTKRQ